MLTIICYISADNMTITDGSFCVSSFRSELSIFIDYDSVALRPRYGRFVRLQIIMEFYLVKNHNYMS